MHVVRMVTLKPTLSLISRPKQVVFRCQCAVYSAEPGKSINAFDCNGGEIIPLTFLQSSTSIDAQDPRRTGNRDQQWWWRHSRSNRDQRFKSQTKEQSAVFKIMTFYWHISLLHWVPVVLPCFPASFDVRAGPDTRGKQSATVMMTSFTIK